MVSNSFEIVRKSDRTIYFRFKTPLGDLKPLCLTKKSFS